MISPTKARLKPCKQCGKCCEIHPCALATEDLPRIASFLGLSEEELFKQFLVLDYVENSGGRSCYVSPARKNDRPGRLVATDWTFADSACIFLRDNKCSIAQVKPKGGREFNCSLMADSKRNLIGYGKKKASQDWSKNDLLNRLVFLAETADGHKS